ATLTLSGEGNGFTSVTVALEGAGLARPAISSEPASVNFGDIIKGESKSETVTVTLANPQNQLTSSSFTLAAGAEGIFEVVSVTVEDNVAAVVLSFSPATAQEYLDTLVVQADYAEEYRIPLSGTGANPTGIGSVDGPGVESRRATSLQVSVRNGDIIVSQATAGSKVSIYNLQGQLLITQRVASDAEILETKSFPRGVYIVTVNELRRKILK
ncbi:MAG: T9SS type A sorting domain-containing protein, partial [Tannerella sp.]|nr:T9SS type A sorting domain-containing protein [Tannerella sp.]